MSENLFQRTIDDLTAYRGEGEEEGITICHEMKARIFGTAFDAWCIYVVWRLPDDYGSKYAFRIKAEGGPYHEYCVYPAKTMKVFTFNDYSDFVSQFKKAEELLSTRHCTFHGLRCSGGEWCRVALCDDEGTTVCAICQEEKPTLQLEETRCGHLFCLSCLDKWAVSEYGKWAKIDDYEAFRCPLCREDLCLCLVCHEPRKFCRCGE